MLRLLSAAPAALLHARGPVRALAAAPLACSSLSGPAVWPALPIVSLVPPHRRPAAYNSGYMSHLPGPLSPLPTHSHYRPAAYNFGYMNPSEPECRNIIKRWGRRGGQGRRGRGGGREMVGGGWQAGCQGVRGGGEEGRGGGEGRRDEGRGPAPHCPLRCCEGAPLLSPYTRPLPATPTLL